jgi:hypothetical protein
MFNTKCGKAREEMEKRLKPPSDPTPAYLISLFSCPEPYLPHLRDLCNQS